MSAPIFEFRASPAGLAQGSLYARFGKRALDLAFVLCALPVVLPLLAVLLALTGLSGAPLYTQDRIGRDGRRFRMWKIRTMVPGADAALERLLAANPDLAREWSVRQKLVPDPRVTRFGAFLRRTSLDELPQLWNVLDGSMSLVGPRPFTPAQRDLYLAAAPDRSYFNLRPGLTGLWQVGPRNASNFAHRAAIDSRYARELCLGTDIAIVARTFRAVAAGTGA